MDNEWIKYQQTGCPVDGDVFVDVKWRDDTEEHNCAAEEWNWHNIYPPITHWRLHKPQEEKFLEDAYDVRTGTQPDYWPGSTVHIDDGALKIPLSKRVSEAVNILTQKNISADDVELIVDIYKRMDK